MTKNWLKLILLAIINFYNINEVYASRYKPDWQSIDSRPLPEWFDQSKIGIFIHWGVYSVPSFGTKLDASLRTGSEWFWWSWMDQHKPEYKKFMSKNYRPDFTYPDFGREFTAEFFNASQWAEIFAASGARYLILTSKHHEGFTLWPSKFSWNWNSKDIGPRKDLLGELATAIRSTTSIRFGVYHSWFEWFNLFTQAKTLPELKEVVNKYKPEIIWSDGDWEATDKYWNSTEFLAWLYNQSPVKDLVVVNDRWGIGTSCKHGGYYSCQDRFNPGVLQDHKWENAMTIDKSSWGFRRDAQLNDYMTIEELIKTLAQTISCNGNLLINVGPTHDGRIVPVFEERLRQLGHWLSINGEAIYKSRPWTYQNDTLTSGVWYTQQSTCVFAIILNWPSSNDQNIILGSVNARQVGSIQMIGYDKPLNFWAANKGITVQLPQLSPNSQLRWAWVLKISRIAA